VPIKRLHTRQQLAVVAAGYQDLGVRADGGLQDRERTGCEFVFFDLRDFVFAAGRGQWVEVVELDAVSSEGRMGERRVEDGRTYVSSLRGLLSRSLELG